MLCHLASTSRHRREISVVSVSTPISLLVFPNEMEVLLNIPKTTGWRCCFILRAAFHLLSARAPEGQGAFSGDPGLHCDLLIDFPVIWSGRAQAKSYGQRWGREWKKGLWIGKVKGFNGHWIGCYINHVPWLCVNLFFGKIKRGLPWWLSGKESTCQCRRCRRHKFNHWLRMIPWRRKWQLTLVFLPGKSRRQRSLVSCST